jgi:hypothetical protein
LAVDACSVAASEVRDDKAGGAPSDLHVLAGAVRVGDADASRAIPTEDEGFAVEGEGSARRAAAREDEDHAGATSAWLA